MIFVGGALRSRRRLRGNLHNISRLSLVGFYVVYRQVLIKHTRARRVLTISLFYYVRGWAFPISSKYLAHVHDSAHYVAARMRAENPTCCGHESGGEPFSIAAER